MAKESLEKITFVEEDGTQAEFFVVEQTVLAGVTYLLVTEDEDGDADAWIMKDTSETEDEEGVYEFVGDERELDAVAAVFSEILEDVDLEK